MNKSIYLILFCLLSLNLSAQCYLDRHNTSLENAWITCTKQNNPNSVRGNSHWIVYDFGEAHQLGKTHFWNVNTPDRTNMGLKDAVIDYSLDFTNWNEWGEFSLAEANASGFYEGEAGPDLTGINARYVLITINENHGNICSGFGEVKIETYGISTHTEDLALAVQNISLNPNPAVEFSNLKVDSDINQKVRIKILDLSGKSVYEFDQNLNEGENNIKLDLLKYPSGQYVVNIENGLQSKSVKLSIVNP